MIARAERDMKAAETKKRQKDLLVGEDSVTVVKPEEKITEEPAEKKARKLARARKTEVAEKKYVITEEPAPRGRRESKNRKIRRLIKEGKEAHEAEDYTLAITRFQEVLEIDGRNRQAQAHLQKSQDMLSSLESGKEDLGVFDQEVEETKLVTPETMVTEVTMPTVKPAEPFDKEPPVYLTLSGCMKITRANTLSVRIALEEIDLAKMKIRTAREGIFPSWDVLWKETRGTTTGQDFTGREITLEMQYPIWNAGKNRSLYKQSKVNYEIAKQNFQKEIIDLDFKVEQAFLLLANAIQDVAYLKELNDFIVNDLKMARDRYELGLSRKVELLRVESQEVKVNYKLQAAIKDMELAWLTMQQVLNSENDRPFYIDAKLGKYLLDANIEQLVELAMTHRQDLKVNAFLVEYNKLGTTVANSEYAFNVNLEGAIGMNGEAFITESLDMTNEWFAGVKVTKAFWDHTLEDNFISQDKVPSVGQTTSTKFTSNTLKLYLWNNHALQNMKEADIKYLKSVDEYIKKLNSIIFEVRKNYFEYLKSIDQLESNRLEVELNKEQLKILDARAKINETLTSEILDTKDRLYKASIDLEEARTGYYTSIANINKSIGITDFFDFKTAIEERQPVPGAWKIFLNDPNVINIQGYGEFAIDEKKQKKEKAAKSRRARVQVIDLEKEAQKEAKAEAKLETEEAKLLKAEEAAARKAERAAQKQAEKEAREKTHAEAKVKKAEEAAARKAERAAAAEKKKQVNAVLKESNKLYKEKKYEEAIQSYKQVLQIDPENRKAKASINKSQKALQKVSEQEQK